MSKRLRSKRLRSKRSKRSKSRRSKRFSRFRSSFDELDVWMDTLNDQTPADMEMYPLLAFITPLDFSEVTIILHEDIDNYKAQKKLQQNRENEYLRQAYNESLRGSEKRMLERKKLTQDIVSLLIKEFTKIYGEIQIQTRTNKIPVFITLRNVKYTYCMHAMTGNYIINDIRLECLHYIEQKITNGETIQSIRERYRDVFETHLIPFAKRYKDREILQDQIPKEILQDQKKLNKAAKQAAASLVQKSIKKVIQELEIQEVIDLIVGEAAQEEAEHVAWESILNM